MPVANMLAAAVGAGRAAVNGAHKISQRHRDRLALVYLRQSTAAQVRTTPSRPCASTDWPTPRSISDGTAPRLWFSTGISGSQAAAPGAGATSSRL